VILLFLIYANKKHGRIFEIIHDFIFPVAAVFLIFDSLGWLVHYVNPVDKDQLSPTAHREAETAKAHRG